MKEKTLKNAVAAYRESRENKMTNLQVASLVQLLSQEVVLDDFGQEVPDCDFVVRKKAVIAKIVEYESK